MQEQDAIRKSAQSCQSHNQTNRSSDTPPPHPVYPVHPCKLKIGAPPMSLSQLRTQVNSIKRKLVRELRVVRARRVAEDYCDLWASLVARKKLPPDPFRLLRNLFKHTKQPGNFPPDPFRLLINPRQAFARATGKLQAHRRRRRLPEPLPRATPPPLSRRHTLPPAARRGQPRPHILLDPRPRQILSIPIILIQRIIESPCQTGSLDETGRGHRIAADLPARP